MKMTMMNKILCSAAITGCAFLFPVNVSAENISEEYVVTEKTLFTLPEGAEFISVEETTEFSEAIETTRPPIFTGFVPITTPESFDAADVDDIIEDDEYVLTDEEQ